MGGLSRWLIPSRSRLRAGYGPLDILNGVDLDVPLGQFVALMGPNGAGKSTLLKTLFGMTTFKGGSGPLAGRTRGHCRAPILATGIRSCRRAAATFPK